jgi:hypothetical protein
MLKKMILSLAVVGSASVQAMEGSNYIFCGSFGYCPSVLGADAKNVEPDGMDEKANLDSLYEQYKVKFCNILESGLGSYAEQRKKDKKLDVILQLQLQTAQQSIEIIFEFYKTSSGDLEKIHNIMNWLIQCDDISKQSTFLEGLVIGIDLAHPVLGHDGANPTLEHDGSEG